MNKLLIFITIILTLFILTNCDGKKTVSQSGYQNNIYSYLSEVAAEITDNSLSGIETIEGWKSIREKRHNEFIEMMGIQDYYYNERTDLNVTVTGTIQKEGYSIKKLYYESLPGLYVPANLYIPDNIEEPTAAVLYVCGHAPTQKVHHQPFPKKFAELGFVSLVIETIQMGEVRGYHWGCYARGWFHWYSRGYNPGGVELWNAIRGLDLLESMPEVDPEKMGVTGISGGGSQSWYIGAADARVKAIAPVCGASTLKDQIGKRNIDRNCDCMMPVNTYQIDFQDVGALIAPRALLIGQADRDGVYTIEAVEELYSDIKKVYGLYGASDQIGLVSTPGGHSYHKTSRELIHSFLIKQLMGKDVTPEEAGDIMMNRDSMLSEDELRVYVDGIPEDDRTRKIQDSFVQLPGAPEISSKEELTAYRDTVKSLLAQKTFGAFPKERIPLNSMMEYRAGDGAKYGWNTYSFNSEKGWRLRVDIHWRTKPDTKKPLMIVLRNYDEDRLASKSFVSDLDSSWNIAYFETRGIGENGWPPNLNWHIRRAAAWTGRTVASMQVYDVLRCLEYCRTHENVDPEQIGIAARGDMAAVALYTALLDGKCKKLILKNPPATQDAPSQPDGRGETIEMLNCLRITDVYEIPALIYPTEVEYKSKIPETYNWSDEIINKLKKN